MKVMETTRTKLKHQNLLTRFIIIKMMFHNQMKDFSTEPLKISS